MRVTGSVLTLMLTSCATHVVAPDEGGGDSLVGAWHLAALEEPGTDGALHAADATGQLLFTPDGHVSVHVMYRDQTAGPPAYSVGGYEATFGTYRIHPGARTFTIHVEGALVRSLIGKDLPRAFEHVAGQLIVTSTHPNEHWKVTWVRP